MEKITRYEAFNRLCDLLSEMQTELSTRQWSDKHSDRCARAYKLREDIQDAIAEYRDCCSPATKVTP